MNQYDIHCELLKKKSKHYKPFVTEKIETTIVEKQLKNRKLSLKHCKKRTHWMKDTRITQTITLQLKKKK
jgi:hypothetical protein